VSYGLISIKLVTQSIDRPQSSFRGLVQQ